MRTKVFFHGPLRAICPEPVEVEGATAAEVMEALSYQLQGLQPDAVHGMKRLQLLGFDTPESLYAPLDKDELHVTPSIKFGKENGVVEIIVGVTLIVVGIAMGGVFWPAVFIQAGISLVIGGLLQMMMPQPTFSSVEEERSRYLGPPGNTTAAGTRIAIGYGRDLVQGHVLGFDIDATDLGT